MACVCVDPKYENQGIGGKLMGFAEDHARDWVCSSCSACRRRRSTTSCRRAASAWPCPTTCQRTGAQRYDRSGPDSRILMKELVSKVEVEA